MKKIIHTVVILLSLILSMIWVNSKFDHVMQRLEAIEKSLIRITTAAANL